jgi:hypothetical protein
LSAAFLGALTTTSSSSASSSSSAFFLYLKFKNGMVTKALALLEPLFAFLGTLYSDCPVLAPHAANFHQKSIVWFANFFSYFYLR